MVSVFALTATCVWRWQFPEFTDDDGEVRLPDASDGEPVYGDDGEYVLGAQVQPQDDEAEITLHAGEQAEATRWLAERGWDKQEGYKTASDRIATALGARGL
jgi:hypothetical protein